MMERNDMRVAVLGGGGWGRHVIRTFHEIGALSAVADPCLETPRSGRESALPVMRVLEHASHQLRDHLGISV